MRVLFGAARGKNHRGARRPEQSCRLKQFRLWKAGERLHTFGPESCHCMAHGLEPFRPIADVRGVNEAVANQDVKQSVGEGRVRSRAQTQMKAGPLGRR